MASQASAAVAATGEAAAATGEVAEATGVAAATSEVVEDGHSLTLVAAVATPTGVVAVHLGVAVVADGDIPALTTTLTAPSIEAAARISKTTPASVLRSVKASRIHSLLTPTTV